MAPLCIEVADAPSTAAFRADQAIAGPAGEILKNTQGVVKVYYGLQFEEEKHVYVCNVWERLDDHRRLQADAVAYPLLGKACAQFMAGGSRIVHIYPTSEPYGALAAPATELAYVTVKPGQSKEKVDEYGAALMALMNGLPESYGVRTAVWGQTEENPNTIAFVIGWTSVEAHFNTVKTHPEAIRLLTELREIADITLSHAELKAY
ncbi:hypothetical protein BKA93DRAFT_822942 [Sparassis latifolia]|uniref:ABM domain-containing protein n=1 Tax=Sparassis crispa TaxID=139825 RepID=A0A401GKJ3_9APHY|nr:hypothetical protein SCP_0410540 [Sparassis crispa]GBE82669.1 hypothetical protein SCP_0410540 [Sparassis crispa]